MSPCVGASDGTELRDLGLLLLSVLAVGEQVIRIAGAHDAGAGQRERDAGSVDGDPAAAPLFGNVGRGAGTAGRIEDKIARIGSHENAAFNDLR